MTGNPIGHAAYYYEKFILGLPDHDVNAVLDNIMIYYLTNSAHTSGRVYAQLLVTTQHESDLYRVPVQVPVACARFHRDVGHMLDWQLRDKYVNLVQSTWHPRGGHFAAMEVPETLYMDFEQFVRKVHVT